MTDKADTNGQGIRVAPGSSELAPFIYCDGAATYGVNNGIVQVELAANSIMPDGQGTRTDVLIVAHLRCSPTAARGLVDCLTKALGMSTSDQAIEPVPHSKPH
jgi:hypothetical protein